MSEEQSLKDKTAKGLFWGGFSNGIQQLLNLVFGIFIARHHYMDETHLREADEVVFSFSKAGAFILFGYFMLKLIDMLVQANLP